MKTHGTIWFARWHVARWMIHTGLLVAPPGKTRKSLTSWISTWGRMVTAEVEADRVRRAALSEGERDGS